VHRNGTRAGSDSSYRVGEMTKEDLVAKVQSGRVEVLPVVEERAVVRKRRRVTQAVQVRTTVHEQEQLVERPVIAEAVTVERVPVDRWVEAPLPVREEGEVTIVPVHEEVVVVKTRLKLVEELHIRRQRVTSTARERVRLRREEASVDRIEASAPGEGDRD
jgi:stress response protein YsnF